MNVKKGTRVRVKNLNKVGTVTDIELLTKKGQLMKYCQVKLDGVDYDYWAPADQLLPPKERMHIKIESSDYDLLAVLIADINYEDKTCNLSAQVSNVTTVSGITEYVEHAQRIFELILPELRGNGSPANDQ